MALLPKTANVLNDNLFKLYVLETILMHTVHRIEIAASL